MAAFVIWTSTSGMFMNWFCDKKYQKIVVTQQSAKSFSKPAERLSFSLEVMAGDISKSIEKFVKAISSPVLNWTKVCFTRKYRIIISTSMDI